MRIVDDITVHDDGSVSLGRLAAFVRDRRVPLEMCPTSNVHTGGAPSIAEHPFDLLRRLRFRVTVNTDNRLMSGVSLVDEFAALDEAFGLGLGEMEWLTINALKSAFAPFDERLRLINEVVKPGYAHLRAEALGRRAGPAPRPGGRRPASAQRPRPAAPPRSGSRRTRWLDPHPAAHRLHQSPGGEQADPRPTRLRPRSTRTYGWKTPPSRRSGRPARRR